MSQLETFEESATRVSAVVERVADWDGARRRITEIVGDMPALVDEHPELDALSLSTAEDAWSAEHGVSVALGGAAQTGTVVLGSAPGRPRTTGVTTLHHTVCLPASLIHDTYADLMTSITSQRPVPSMLRFTTGPSRSGDIELKTIYGMHGPRTLTILVVTGA